MIKLFKASSIVNNFKHRGGIYTKVPFMWFVRNRDNPVIPYEKGISDYKKRSNEKHKSYQEEALDELFTEEEVEALMGYLLKSYDTDCHIEEVNLPIDSNCGGWGVLAVGGETDFYMLSKTDDYNLPFETWGYFDVRWAKTLPP